MRIPRHSPDAPDAVIERTLADVQRFARKEGVPLLGWQVDFLRRWHARDSVESLAAGGSR